MANPLRIAYQNLADPPGVVAASSAESLLPASNLQTSDIRELWRATSGTADIILDMGASLTVQAVALIRTNLAGTDTVRVRMSASDPTVTSSLAHDSGVLTPDIDTTHKRFVYFIDAGVTARYVRLDLGAAAAAEAGRLLVARAWTPSSNMQYGWQRTWRDPSRISESLGQIRYTDVRERQRGYAFRLTGLTETEVFDEIDEINRINGTSVDLLICRDSAATAAALGRETIWGTLEQPIDYQQPRPLSYDATFTIYDRDRL